MVFSLTALDKLPMSEMPLTCVLGVLVLGSFFLFPGFGHWHRNFVLRWLMITALKNSRAKRQKSGWSCGITFHALSLSIILYKFVKVFCMARGIGLYVYTNTEMQPQILYCAQYTLPKNRKGWVTILTFYCSVARQYQLPVRQYCWLNHNYFFDVPVARC